MRPVTTVPRPWIPNINSICIRNALPATRTATETDSHTALTATSLLLLLVSAADDICTAACLCRTSVSTSKNYTCSPTIMAYAHFGYTLLELSVTIIHRPDLPCIVVRFFFFNDPAPPEFSPLPLRDALPI